MTILPFLTSCIDTLLEWFDAQSLDRVDETFIRPLAQGQIGFDDILDHVGDLVVTCTAGPIKVPSSAFSLARPPMVIW